ncbi:Uncharacterised protein [Actinobacillus pleuropneumoniae]|nr:Uncharacterised protein [Actinobacillus pleuropneumoniae]
MAHVKNRTETTILLLPKVRTELSNNLNNIRLNDLDFTRFKITDGTLL